MATQILGEARDALSATRVYAEPFIKNGTTVIPAAAVRGGAGGGEAPDGKGESGGFGLSAHPTGAWVIQGEDVRWKPAVDVTRIAILGEVVGLLRAVRVALGRARAGASPADRAAPGGSRLRWRSRGRGAGSRSPAMGAHAARDVHARGPVRPRRSLAGRLRALTTPPRRGGSNAAHGRATLPDRF